MELGVTARRAIAGGCLSAAAAKLLLAHQEVDALLAICRAQLKAVFRLGCGTSKSAILQTVRAELIS
jgi:hypothetical protein